MFFYNFLYFVKKICEFNEQNCPGWIWEKVKLGHCVGLNNVQSWWGNGIKRLTFLYLYILNDTFIGNILKIAFAIEISDAGLNNVGIILYFKAEFSTNRPICCILLFCYWKVVSISEWEGREWQSWCHILDEEFVSRKRGEVSVAPLQRAGNPG